MLTALISVLDLPPYSQISEKIQICLWESDAFPVKNDKKVQQDMEDNITF